MKKFFKAFIANLLICSLLCLWGCGPDTKDVPAPEIADEVWEEVLETPATSNEESEPETGNEPEEVIELGPVILGDDRPEVYLPYLEGRRIAVFSNQSGIVGDDESKGHILDALIEEGLEVKAIFSPEHGFRGDADAGSGVDDSVDAKTGIPILSLYGNGHYPSDESMGTFDVLVVDIQDVGLRYYTYYVTMFYLMEACARDGKSVVILDRPNPNGSYVDGGILKDEYKSGVGLLPIPTVHGMTLGELALMINGEGWLSTGKDSLDLYVVGCENYTHSTRYDLLKNPSPNLKDMKAVYLYASTCYFENTVITVGRGTEFPFEVYGSPYLEGVEGNDFTFTPVSMSGATSPLYEGITCFGKDLRGKSDEDILSEGICLEYLINAYNDYMSTGSEGDFFGTPDKNGKYWIDYLSGSDELRNDIVAGMSEQEIKATWLADIAAFKELRKPYLLYGD
ncbi:MAG: DUF1343 domain-containing protein [Lachnospiraceae bacterium]|nr:DUF1343 domain-containing protein [Lachnospiraceae bacterium]